MTIDAVIPAHNESRTVAGNVEAALGCRFVREVIVVDDGSVDDTGDRARAAGAKVIVREAGGSKAHAMAEGVAMSDAAAILFLDADCIDLTSSHLDAICEPYVRGRAVMSLGTFDYGRFWNPFVLRWLPLTGERIVPRWVWDSVPPAKLDGYTIEMRLNEVVAEQRLPIVVRTMRGVSHRTKRDKHGRLDGIRRTWWMYRDLARMIRPLGDVRKRTYWWYLRNLRVER